MVHWDSAVWDGSMADPPKTSPLPIRVSMTNRSFCVKGCRHKYRRTLTIGQSWNSALLGWEEWLTPRYTPLPHMCYHIKFGSSATMGVRINRRDPKIGERWGPTTWVEGVANPKKQATPHMCYHVKFGSSATVYSLIERNPQNCVALGPRPLETRA